MRLERHGHGGRRQPHHFRFPAKDAARSAVLLLRRHDRRQAGGTALGGEILSFIDAFQPDTFARQWCGLSGVGKSLHAETVADFDDMRSEAWLLAAELSEAIASPERHAPPWYHWN